VPAHKPLLTTSASVTLKDLPSPLIASSAIPGISDADRDDLSRILIPRT